MNRFRYIINLIIVFLMFVTVAVNRDGRIFGKSVYDYTLIKKPLPLKETEHKDKGDIKIFESTDLAKDITGYAGPTPLIITISGDTISGVELLDNNETPSYVNYVVSTGILNSWTGLNLNDAEALNVDAVSGATYTSKSIIRTFRRTVQYAASLQPKKEKSDIVSVKNIIGLLVILTGLILTFIKARNKWLRIIQLILNVCVLGFWCGSFLSLSMFTNWISNGVNLSVTILPFVLLILSIILPLFGKKQTYCAWHCPMGSCQELIGKTINKNFTIPDRIEKWLKYSRDSILLLILFIMW